jgi:hypothetical protein
MTKHIATRQIRREPIPRVAECLARIEAGLPPAEVARQTGMSLDAVQQAIIRWRWWQPPPPLQSRRCLCCLEAFDSAGPGERICYVCKRSDEFGGPVTHSVVGIR